MRKNPIKLFVITIAICTIKVECRNVTKPLYANYGDSVILKCLNKSVATSWDGPSSNSSNIFNETPYTVNNHIVQQLPNAKNLMLVGDISVGEYNLKIINITHNEEGYYKCNAQRENQVFEFQYVLRIKEPPTNLTTNGRNGTLVGTAGDEMCIKCNVRRGIPENETKLYLHLNGEIVKESLTGMLIYSFFPKGVNNGDTFRCAVRNMLLDAPLAETIRLNVTDRPSIRFNINENNITVFEGRSFSITCYSESNPFTTELFWSRNGGLIDKNIQHPKSIPLNFAAIKRQHEGKYTCRAKNQNGYGQKSIYITVVCCEVENERTYTVVIVSISVITAVFLGVIILLTKGKLKSRREHASLRDNDLEHENREETTVQNHDEIQINNQAMDCISDEGTKAQVQIREGRAECSTASPNAISNLQDNNVLNYVEIDFTPRFVVHGKENMTIYSEVVLPIASTSALHDK